MKKGQVETEFQQEDRQGDREIQTDKKRQNEERDKKISGRRARKCRETERNKAGGKLRGRDKERQKGQDILQKDTQRHIKKLKETLRDEKELQKQ